MHVLIYVYSLSFGGAERAVSSLANHWIERRWSVTIVTITEASSDFYPLHPDIKRVGLGLDADSSSVLMALWHNWQRLKRLRAVLKETRPDVALGMMASANCVLLLAALGTRVPVIGCERTYPPAFALGRAWDWLRRHTYPHLDAIVVQTEQSASWVREYCATRRIAVIPNSVTVPLSRQEPCVAPPCRSASTGIRNLLLAVGRLIPEKGFDRLISGFSRLAQRHSDWHLCIVGEGGCRQELEEQVARMGLVKRVTLPGLIGNIGEWYEAADVYVMTSLFEGFPNALLEALAYGVPAVTVDCDTGPRDILRDRVDGLLVPQNDEAALVDALEKLVTNEKLRREYAARAIEVQKRFSIDEVTRRWESLFKDVIK